MNEFCGLTGNNACPKDFTILVIDPTSIDLLQVTMARFELGARWFDDVVDNNRRRQVTK